MTAAEVRGTDQKKGCFQVSKEGDTELLSQEGSPWLPEIIHEC